jgi:regulator of replication initiation timing
MTIPSPLSSFKNWCIFLLLLAVAVLWFTGGCHKNPTPAITQNNTVNDTVAKIVAQAQQSQIQVGILMEDTVRLHTELKHARDSLKHSTVIIHAANSQVTALANEVADTRIKKDTTGYYHACDTLASAVKAQNDKFTMFERDSKNALGKCDALSLKKSQMIASLTSEANGYKSAYGLEKKQNGVLAKALNPKAKVYVGLEAWTCPASSGVAPGLMYQSKSEKILGLSGGITTTGGWWIGGKAYIKIQLHK